MKTFRIDSPFFMTAGDQLGWPDGVGSIGVGLAREKMRMHYRDDVQIIDKKGRSYVCPSIVLYVFHLFWPTVYTLKGGRELIVLPLSYFDEQ